MSMYNKRDDVVLTIEDVDDYANMKTTSRSLAEKYGASPYTILQRLKATCRNDVLIAVKSCTKKKRKAVDATTEKKLRKLLDSGIMKKDIAAEFKVTVPTVLAWQKKLGIPVTRQVDKKAKRIEVTETKCKKPVNRYMRAQQLMTQSMTQ